MCFYFDNVIKMEKLRCNNGYIYIHNNNQFIKSKEYTNKKGIVITYFKCKKCLVKLHKRSDSEEFIQRGEHDHDFDQHEVLSKKFEDKIHTNITKNPNESIREIYDKTVKEFKKEQTVNSNNSEFIINASMKPVYSINGRMKWQRKAINNHQKQPQDRKSIGYNLPKIYTTVKRSGREENFLLFNDGDDDKIMIFANQVFLNHLISSNEIFCDGTFYICPSIFGQLYTFHCEINEKMYPLIYALLPDQREETYTRMLSLLKSLETESGTKLNPTLIHIDFELAAIKSF